MFIYKKTIDYKCTKIIYSNILYICKKAIGYEPSIIDTIIQIY